MGPGNRNGHRQCSVTFADARVELAAIAIAVISHCDIPTNSPNKKGESQ
jgi:hypothetical protein